MSNPTIKEYLNAEIQRNLLGRRGDRPAGRRGLLHIAPVEHVGIEGDIRVLSLPGYLKIEDLGSKS